MSFLFFFLVPVMLLVFFYTRMISTIRRANTSNIRRSAYRGNNNGGSTKPPDHRKQTIRMLGGWRVELQTKVRNHEKAPPCAMLNRRYSMVSRRWDADAKVMRVG